MSKKEISQTIRKKLKIQKTKTLLKKAKEIKMSIKEHLLKFRTKDPRKTSPAKNEVFSNKEENLKFAKFPKIPKFSNF